MEDLDIRFALYKILQDVEFIYGKIHFFVNTNSFGGCVTTQTFFKTFSKGVPLQNFIEVVLVINPLFLNEKINIHIHKNQLEKLIKTSNLELVVDCIKIKDFGCMIDLID